jgi:hypothetical protein
MGDNGGVDSKGLKGKWLRFHFPTPTQLKISPEFSPLRNFLKQLIYFKISPIF